MALKKTVHLGYEVGTGDPVSIPIEHLAVVGQTQRSGKTTALEALATRAGAQGWSSLSFVTKRGEGSFRQAAEIRPYFRDEINWQFVLAILEATMQQKLWLHRSFIIKACTGARTLKQVQQNVQLKLENARGFAEGIYTELDAFLELVIPLLDKLPHTSGVDLVPGLNVMELAEYPQQLQQLVIHSSLRWIHEHAKNHLTIIPEAWKFVPEQRGSPVKLAAESLIREGAGLKNYVWIDSQDTAGVAKILLRAASVWMIGVQREQNEIGRNLKNIPEGIGRPSARDVATLSLGQFFVCWEDNVVRTFVQPIWMNDDIAKEIALGEAKLPEDSGSLPQRRSPTMQIVDNGEQPMDAETRQVLSQLTNVVSGLSQQFGQVQKLLSGSPEPPILPCEPPRDEICQPVSGDLESIYQYVRNRLMGEASELVLKLEQKKMVIQYEPVVLNVSGKTQKGRVCVLLQKGFMRSSRTHSEIKKELERTGGKVNGGNLSKELGDLIKMGFLTREEDGFKAVPGMNVTITK